MYIILNRCIIIQGVVSISNEELVKRIQAGERHLLADLWKQNTGYIYRIACSQLRPSDGNHYRDIDDLMQEGFLGMARALESYDGSIPFMKYAQYWIRAFIQRSITNGRSREDLLAGAASLDMPLADSEDICLGDTLVDNHALQPEQAVIAYDIGQIVRAKVDSLPQEEHAVINSRWLDGPPLLMGAKEARELEQKVFRRLSKDNALRGLMGYKVRHKSLQGFRESWTSEVEEEVLRRERVRERREERVLS